MIASDIDLELIFLEDLAKAPHCESDHPPGWPKECSHTPTAVFAAFCTKTHIKVCENIAAVARLKIETEFTHRACGKKCGDCWTVTPL